MRRRLVAGLAALALLTGATAAAAAPACTEYETGDTASIVAPWAAPARNGDPLEILARIPEDDLRLSYQLVVTDEAGRVVLDTSRMWRAKGRDMFGADLSLGTADVRAYRIALTETWDSWMGEPCTTQATRDFVAGGVLPRGPKPPLRVQAVLYDFRGGSRVRALRARVLRDSGETPEVRLIVTTRCLVIDDGLGNGILAPRVLSISMPRQVGGPRVLWDPCGSGPSGRAIGSSWVATKTFKGDFRVRAHSNGRRVSRWEVGFTSWKTHRTGRLEVTHRRYQRATARRVYSSDFDDYWNICVKGPREVWASGGRVYCVIQTRPESSLATVRLRG